MYGFAAQKQLHWSIGFIGYAFIGFGLTAIANIGMTYILDIYSPIADEALLIVNALKNVFAFGFSYGVSPWVTQDGFEKVSLPSHRTTTPLHAYTDEIKIRLSEAWQASF